MRGIRTVKRKLPDRDGKAQARWNVMPDPMRRQNVMVPLLTGCRYCLVGDPHPNGHWCSEQNVVGR